jgi:hypothetical protein
VAAAAKAASRAVVLRSAETRPGIALILGVIYFARSANAAAAFTECSVRYGAGAVEIFEIR